MSEVLLERFRAFVERSAPDHADAVATALSNVLIACADNAEWCVWRRCAPSWQP